MSGSRVAVVGSGWRFTSGISYYTCRLANALADHHTVSVVLARRLIPRMFYPGRARVGRPVNTIDYRDDVAVLDGLDWFWGVSLFRTLSFLRSERPDVLVLQWWTAALLHTYLLLAWWARRRGIPVIVEMHEIQDTGEARVPFAARWARSAGRRLLRGAAAVVVHSPDDAVSVAEQFEVEPAKVTAVAHGPFDHHVHPRREAEPAGDEVRLLFFGTIRPYKGLEHLVEAFSMLDAEDVRKFRLTIAGETWEGWDHPLELAARSPWRERITVVNRYLHDDEVAEAFARADVVVLPYTRSSASGPLHIAMAAGLPVVLTAVGGLPAAAEGYEGVVWVDPADPAALRHALLSARALVGRRFTDPRSWDDTVSTYDGIFDQVVTRRSTSPAPTEARTAA